MMKFLLTLLWCLLAGAGFCAEQVGEAVIKVDGNQAMVSWQTDVATGTRLLVKPEIKSIDVLDVKSPTTNHSARIGGLRPKTEYQVVIGTAKIWLSTNKFTTPAYKTIFGKSQATNNPAVTNVASASKSTKLKAFAPPARNTWASYSTLPDHFERHGADFGAKDEEDYARMAWELLQRAKSDGLPCKVDDEGVLRVYDPKSGAFGSYTKSGKTKTFFKPNSADYFERQPGKKISLKNGY